MFNPTAPVNEQLALYSDLFMLIAAKTTKGGWRWRNGEDE